MSHSNRRLPILVALGAAACLAALVLFLSRFGHTDGPLAQAPTAPAATAPAAPRSSRRANSAWQVNTSSSFTDGHANFLQTAVQFCYLYGDAAQAQFYYDKLRRLYGKTYPHRFDKNLEDFIHDNMVANMDTYANTAQFVQAMVLMALERGLANNRPEVYERFIALARTAHEKWNKDRGLLALPEPIGPHNRQMLLPFDQMVSEIYVGYMNSAGVDPLTRAELWAATPEDMRRHIYDRVAERARAAAIAMHLDPDRAFPEPPGMDEYRRQHPIQPAGGIIKGSAQDPEATVHAGRR